MRYLRSIARSTAVVSALLLAQTAFAAVGAHADSGSAAAGSRAVRVPAPGIYTISNLHSGKCLGVAAPQTAEGAPTIQWSCLAGARDQAWRIAPQVNAPVGAYSIQNINSGLCLTVSDPNTNGSAVVQSACKTIATQGWHMGPTGPNYQLGSYSNGHNLDVTGSSTADGTHVIQWPVTGNSNQVWVLTRVG